MGSPWSVALLRHAEPRTFCSGLWLFFSFPVLPWLPGRCRQRRGTPRPCCTLPHGRPHSGSQIRSYSVSPLCPAGLAGLSGEGLSPPSIDRIAETKSYNLYFEKFFALFAIKKSRPDDMCVRLQGNLTLRVCEPPLRGSAPNFVPRGIPGGRNFCPAQQAEMGSPWSVALLRHAKSLPLARERKRSVFSSGLRPGRGRCFGCGGRSIRPGGTCRSSI